MSERIKTRASMTNPVRAAAVRPSERSSPHATRSWRHGQGDGGPRLADVQIAATAKEIRVALLRGQWTAAIEAALHARGERWTDMGLDLSAVDAEPLSEIEAEYVVAVAETHLTRTDLVWCALAIACLSRPDSDLAERAKNRAEWTRGYESRSLSQRRAAEHGYAARKKAKGVA